jgi:hypothetical protein
VRKWLAVVTVLGLCGCGAGPQAKSGAVCAPADAPEADVRYYGNMWQEGCRMREGYGPPPAGWGKAAAETESAPAAPPENNESGTGQ